MDNIVVRVATPNDALTIKNLINKMYRSEYETRNSDEIEKAIKNRNEFYSIAELYGMQIGFCGATKLNKEKSVASLDYIYINEDSRNLITAYKCLMLVVNELIKDGIESAEMIVQTFNKQRFLHYALSDKNIIAETQRELKGQTIKDQTLLIQSLKSLAKLTFNDLVKKTHQYALDD